jgi:hypothetical protein
MIVPGGGGDSVGITPADVPDEYTKPERDDGPDVDRVPSTTLTVTAAATTTTTTPAHTQPRRVTTHHPSYRP